MAAERLEERCVLTTNTWATALGGSEKDVPVGITATSDGGYAVVGNTESFNAENGNLWLTRFDSNGNLLWTRKYGQSLSVALRGTGDQPFRSFTYDRATDIETTVSGGFRISGYSEFAPGNSSIGWAMEVDSAGVVVAMAGNTFIASDQYTSLSNGAIGGNSIVFTPTSYRFVATVGDVRYGGLLTETSLSQLSSDGIVVGSQGVLNVQTLVANPTGGAVVFGSSEAGVSITKTPVDGAGNSFYGVASVHYAGVGNQSTYSVIRKLATDFSPVWEVSLPGDTATSIRALSDGGFVVALISNRASITNGSSFNVMLAKLDADGELVWAKTYGGLGTEGFLDPFRTTIDLVVTADGFAFTTSTNSFGTNDANTSSLDYWVVKTDLNGNIPVMTGAMRDVTADVNVSPFVGSFGTGVFQNLGPNVGPTDPTFSTFYFYAENDPGPVLTPIGRSVAYGGPLSVATTTVSVVPRVQSVVDYNAGSFQFVSATYETSEDEDVFTEGLLTEPRDFVNVVVARTDTTHGAYGAARVNYSVTWNGSTSSGDATFNNPSGGVDGGTYYLDFANGEISQTFRVYGFLDNDFDPGDSFTLTLSDPDLLNGAVVGALASTTVTILNTNPAPGTVQFSAASYTVDENKQSVTVTVTRTNPSETDMQVSYAVIGGTATGGNAGPADYGNGTTSGTLFFSSSYNGLGEVVSNETSKTFTIPIFDDPDVEGDETIQLQLSNPTNGGLLGSIATTTVTIHDIQPVPQTIVPKFNGKIAFVRSSNIGGNSPDLIIMNPNGSSETNITNSADVQEMSPAWSPDGSKLAYVAFGFVGPVDITGINVINVDGTGRIQLTQNPSDAEPTWSPDGTRIAFVRYDNGKQLMVMNADGNNVEVILADSYIGQPRWSPDGTRIAYEGRSAQTDRDAIFEIGTDGFGKHMLFPSVGSSISSATDGSYTPDGIQMVFRGVDLSLEGRTDGIYRANVDGTGTPERLADGEFQLFLSPEGNRLAFGSTAGSFPRIVLSNLNGTQVVNVTDGSGGDRDPVWQPLLSALPPDTQAPTVLSVTPSTVAINDDFIGTANFSLTVVFSEGMNTSVIPTLSFPVENPNSTLTFNADESGWLYGSTTYVAKYNVVDANKTLPNIDVRVSGGQDLAGNSHVATTFSDKFSLAMAGTFADMTPPTVTAFERFNPLAIQTTASTLVFSVSFSESVDESTVDAADFSVNGSTATITSVTPAEGTFGLSFDVTVSGGNLASFLGAVGLDVRLAADILDTVGLPLTHVGPFVDEVYQHSPSAPNTVPKFTKGANQTVLEDSGQKTATAWATAISPGMGSSDVGQTIDFIVTNTNNALFSVQPAIAANGTLTFTPAADANGTAMVSVKIHDDGGTAIGGVDTSAAQTFTITVTAVNDVPSFTLPNATVTVVEDAAAQTVNNFVTNLSRGPANESAQKLSFLVTNDNAALFKTAPVISATGVLTYTLNPNANGVANVTVKIKDDGLVPNGGVDTSAAQMFAINVTPVNDVPSFKKGADQSTNEDVAVSVNWATLISAGAPNESGQSLDFQLTNDNNALFAVQPAIGADGKLTYTPALNASGVANLTARLHDNGGGTAPNVDLSAAQTFKITIKPINDLPTATVLLPQTIAEDTSTGPLAFTVGDVETPAANLTLAALSSTNTKLIPLTGITFGPPSGANRTVTVTPAANQFGTATIAFTIKDANGGVLTQNVLITVTPVNDAPPTITNIADLAVNEDTATAALKFTVDDVDDKLVNLNAIIVTATSSNTALVPNAPANIVLGGSLGARTIQLKPLADQFGITTITVTATDSSGATMTDTFDLTVTSVNDAPRVTAATLTIPEFTAANTIVGTVAAIDPDAGDTVTGFAIASGNTSSAFKIDNAGVIRVNNADMLDFETATLKTFTLAISATDNRGLAGAASKTPAELGPITVNVTNQPLALTVSALDSDNTVTVLRVGNNLVARRGGVDLFTPTPLEDVTSLTITGGAARDTVMLDASLNSVGNPTTHTFAGQILVNGKSGHDSLDASKITVATFGIVFDGGADNDAALGGSGNETLSGGDGNDSINGGAGNDLLTGGKGDDQLLGGAGNDTYAFGDTDTSETDTLTEATNAGTDTLNFNTLTTAATVDLNSEASLATHLNRTIKTSAMGTTKLALNFENVIGGIGDDSILGNAVANSLLGGSGHDTIKGGVGNDSINGGAGNDAIRGDDGNDLLSGGADNDTIIGGAGNDAIHGDEGDDTTIGSLGTDQVFGDAGTDFGLGGRGGPARGGTGVKDTGDVLNASLETINEAFATIFAFE